MLSTILLPCQFQQIVDDFTRILHPLSEVTSGEVIPLRSSAEKP